MTIFRGVLLTHKQVGQLRRYVGRRFPHRSHAWWATVRKIAVVYATTPNVRSRLIKEPTVPVLLTANLSGWSSDAPTLPDLRSIPGVELTLHSVEVLHG